MAKEGSGLGKKILIGLAIIALVAIIVVVILLCIPPNTYNAVETLDRTTNNMFLSKQEENSNFESLKSKVEQYDLSYKEELEDYQNIRDNLHTILIYFNNNLKFASNNKNLKNNYKAIKNNLNKSQDSRNKLDDILSKSVESGTAINVRNNMLDLRWEYISWLKYNRAAIQALSRGYNGSMGNTLNNNLASKTIFDVVADDLQVVINQLSDMAQYDHRALTPEDVKEIYKNQINGTSNLLGQIVSKLSSDVNSYYFKTDVQETYQKFEKFKEVYNLSNIQTVIESVTYSNEKLSFTKTFDGIADDEGLYTAAKKFLGGEA